MEATYQFNSKKYPYLAVHVGAGSHIAKDFFDNIKLEDIVLISMIKPTVSNGDTVSFGSIDKVPYVQLLLGGQEALKIKDENDFVPLPSGFEVKIIQ